MTAPLALAEPRRPWQRQHGESAAEHAAFAVWLLTEPRQQSLTGALHDLSIRFDWFRRALLIDAQLSTKAESVEEAVAGIAQDSLVILRSELAYKAARAAQHPGDMKQADITALLRLVAEMGALSSKGAPAPAPDYSTLTPRELAVVAEAGLLMARCSAKRLT